MLSAVKLVNKYSGRFDELEERIDILYRNLEKRINGLLADLINEVKDAVKTLIQYYSFTKDIAL